MALFLFIQVNILQQDNQRVTRDIRQRIIKNIGVGLNHRKFETSNPSKQINST